MATLRKLGAKRPKLTPAQVKASAHRAGYTRRVICEYGDADFYLYVTPAANFAGKFTGIDDETGTIRNFDGAGDECTVRDLDD